MKFETSSPNQNTGLWNSIFCTTIPANLIKNATSVLFDFTLSSDFNIAASQEEQDEIVKRFWHLEIRDRDTNKVFQDIGVNRTNFIFRFYENDNRKFRIELRNTILTSDLFMPDENKKILIMLHTNNKSDLFTFKAEKSSLSIKY